MRPNADAEDYSDYYELSLTRHPTFNEMRETWYGSGEKRFPEVNITEEVLRHWYLCDGGISVKSDDSPRANIYTVNEEDRLEWLCGLFDDTPFDPRAGRERLAFMQSNHEIFLEWVRPEVTGFEKKYATSWEDYLERDEFKSRTEDLYTYYR